MFCLNYYIIIRNSNRAWDKFRSIFLKLGKFAHDSNRSARGIPSGYELSVSLVAALSHQIESSLNPRRKKKNTWFTQAFIAAGSAAEYELKMGKHTP